MKEAEVLRGVRVLFELAGWLVIRTQAGTSRGGRMHHAPAGWPDLTCFGPRGQVALVELKRPEGKLRPEQREMHKSLYLRGHKVWVVRGIEDAAEIAQRRG